MTERPAAVSSTQELGQLASIESSTSSVGVPLIQSTIPVQNVPAPTAPGIRSEASKRKVVFGSCRVSRACDRMALDAFAGSRPLFALITPPRLTRLLAQS